MTDLGLMLSENIILMTVWLIRRHHIGKWNGEIGGLE